MGWSWSVRPIDVLQNYPSLADIPILQERWPGLREAAEQLKQQNASKKGDKEPPKDKNVGR
jgi:hypothetical protein